MKMSSKVARKVGLGRVRIVVRIWEPGMARSRESFSDVGRVRGIWNAVQRSLNCPVAKG
jgi:hypothetical protein